MKTKKITGRIQKIALIIALAIFLVPVTSCAQRVNFLVSTVTPAAKGSVKVKEDSNKNYRIKIHIVDLAEPERLSPPRNAYVVWMVADDNVPKNIGQIKTSTALFSNKLKADFESVSVEKPKKIFITAENDPSIQYMYSEMILTTNNF
ncbi:MAG: hypothetical protein ACD_77C00410G0002 [uncultured bacterium]|nr:MAG: hypothetical protein ACD_77C00410G0002 [uncultured bacterium]HBY01374.1 hypothetical protein [Rikenellaceae bacterium]